MRTVLITGTSSGIGRACALRLARNGWHVFAGVRNGADGENLRAELEDEFELSPIELDVTNPDARVHAIEKISTDASRLDALVNNAGAVSTGPLECLCIDDIRRDIETNLISAIALTQVCLPSIRESRGRIVNVGSSQDLLTPPYFGGYTMSKWGMRAFHEALRLELRPWNIECILVVPGRVKTRIWDSVPAMVAELGKMSSGATKLYEPLASAMRDASISFAENGLDADVVAGTIEKALNDNKPKAEVIVGADARFMMRPVGWLPTRLRESIVSKLFKLP